ncbi:hypothetical protein PR048_018932 [Dryococelus australis]|uniref:Uncharacterized protein n=1 Tax=Dryococelus australis TaxID=614101 RepID=A0ABQ9H219_9NEOP|nr:hypothetical protein PR048_018932 [Dryococelus australis]
MQGRGKQETSEETRRPAASSGMMHTHENTGAVPSGIEPGFTLSWEESRANKFLPHLRSHPQDDVVMSHVRTTRI